MRAYKTSLIQIGRSVPIGQHLVNPTRLRDQLGGAKVATMRLNNKLQLLNRLYMHSVLNKDFQWKLPKRR